MFSLGSISSVIPILILAITYFVGLTTYSLSFAQNKSSEKRNSEKCIQHAVKEDVISSNTAQFEQNRNDGIKYLEVNSTNYLQTIKAYLIIGKVISSPPYFTNNFKRSLFLRPPPEII